MAGISTGTDGSRAQEGSAARGLQDRRRREPRIDCQRTIELRRCAPPDSGSEITAQLTDCSLHGLGLMLSDSVEPGQPVVVTIEQGPQQTSLMYTIRYCIPMQINRFRAGAKFTGLVVEKFQGELSRVLASLTAGK